MEKYTKAFKDYIEKKRTETAFYFGGKEVSWEDIPLDVRKHDYSYYFDKDGNDCYPESCERLKKSYEWYNYKEGYKKALEDAYIWLRDHIRLVDYLDHPFSSIAYPKNGVEFADKFFKDMEE